MSVIPGTRLGLDGFYSFGDPSGTELRLAADPLLTKSLRWLRPSLPEGRGRIWYWFRDQARAAWYPSVEFLRQSMAAEWEPVIAGVAKRLAEWATGRSG